MAFPEIHSKEDVKAHINETEANIRRFTTQIDELERARQKERRTLARLWFIIVPLGKLPTELLVEIFHLAVQPESCSTDDRIGIVVDRNTPAFGTHHPVHQSLLLSQVCSSWRNIVVGSPKLWAAGSVDVRLDRHRYSPENYVDGLKILLDRSLPLPVHVSLTCENDDLHTTEVHRHILRAMIPTASRWKTLKMDSWSVDNLSLLDTPPGPFTTLEALDLAVLHSNNMHLFFICPRLRHLKLVVIENGDRISVDDVLRIPWAQLTHLELQEEDPTTCRFILLQCTNIVSAKLITLDWDTPDVAAAATVLPFLKTLEVHFEASSHVVGYIAPFFTALSLPSLQTFRLGLSHIDWPPEDFSAFQMRAPNIAQISLIGCRIASQQLITLLRLTPALTMLTLFDCVNCIDNEFLRAFSYNETGAQWLVPQLRELDWRCIRDLFDADVFEAAIRSRYWTGDAAPAGMARLRSVTLEKSTFPILFDWMRELIEQGLVLHII
jgi:hypothetical protein